MTDKRRGLGRGLHDLLSPSDWLKREDIQLFYCPVDRLGPNPYQPRQLIDDVSMEELVDSVREKGVLQPILVTRAEDPDQYLIIAGERRWKAARLAGLAEVPVILRDTSSAEALELALIENIQRRDLNCIEEALAYRRLQEEFSLTQEEIAKRVGKNRSTVANLLRLLHLPPEIQEDILNEKLTMGHARALVSVDDPEERRRLRDLVVSRDLSVRETERLVAKSQLPAGVPAVRDPYLQQLQHSMRSHFGVKVALRRKGQRGAIVIPFKSSEELDRLVKALGLENS